MALTPDTASLVLRRMIMNKDYPDQLDGETTNTFLKILALTCMDFKIFVESLLSKRLFRANPHADDFLAFKIEIMNDLLKEYRKVVWDVICDMPKKVEAEITVVQQTQYEGEYRPYIIKLNKQCVAKMTTSRRLYWNKLVVSYYPKQLRTINIQLTGRTDIMTQKSVEEHTIWYRPAIDTEGAYVAIKDALDGWPTRIRRAAFRELVRAKITAVIDAHEY